MEKEGAKEWMKERRREEGGKQRREGNREDRLIVEEGAEGAGEGGARGWRVELSGRRRIWRAWEMRRVREQGDDGW